MMARTTKAEDLREQDLMLAHGDLSDALGELAQIYLRYPVLMQFTNAIEMKLKAAQARIRSELDRGAAARSERKQLESRGNR